MASLPPPDEKARAVREMFDRIAPRYDRANRVLTGRFDQRWRRSLVQRLRIGPADRVLDLACGTGDFAELARNEGAEVYGLDFSRGMLEGALRRGLHGIDFVQGDALHLPFPSRMFTAAVSGFALRNFTEIEPVLHELGRVIGPGGTIGLLEVDEPRNRVLRWGHSVYFERMVPLIGGLLTRDRAAYSYLPESAAYLPPERELAAMLRSAGFEQIRKRRHMGGAIQAISAVRS